MCALALTTDEILHPPHEGAWSLDDAYAYCEHLTRSHYENFPVASWRLRGEKRRFVYAVYAFARAADDFADESQFDGERLPALDRWERELGECIDGEAAHPTFIALGDTLRRCEIPVQLFRDLIHAFRQDVTKKRYATYRELLEYCRHSANPVGRIVLAIFDYRDEELEHQSDCICTGLQLANHWQDVDIDRKKDRIYLPLEDMDNYGYSVDQLLARSSNAAFRDLMYCEVGRARQLFAEGKPLCTRVGHDIGLEMRATWLGGTRILRKIEEVNFDVFNYRPTINALDKLSILIAALAGWGFRHDERPAKKRVSEHV